MSLVGSALTAAVVATACGTSEVTDTAGDGPIRIVASTNVWGSIAGAVAGEHAEVEAIIEEPSADPHSFEASPADAAAITQASLVVYNGGGYDEFVDDVLGSSSRDVPTVEAFTLAENAADTPDEAAAHDDEDGTDDHSGHVHGAINEHLWYDTDVVAGVAQQIAEQLSSLDPDNAGAYEANAEAFGARLADVDNVIAAIAASAPGARVAQTEPIAHYLVEAAGLDDITPGEFEDAVENGNDPSPAAIADTLTLVGDKRVRVLIYNIQTESSVTANLRTAAESAGVPVVEVTETLPEDTDYLTWLSATTQSLADAVAAN
uniref:Uncharacterized protein n=1 Tax=Rhodococcus sp. NS1 TaxID=402236 RepID=A0A097SPK3_9NOCA|nr:hypothetical protein LRS1606.20 [Rhodococcus sp. NS1]